MKKPKRVNSFSVTIAILTVIFGYVGWWFLPQWFPIFKITGMMRGTCNDMYRNPDNEKLIQQFLLASRRSGLVITKDHIELIRYMPTPEELMAMDLSGSQVEVVKRRGTKCIFRFHYESEAPWPLIGSTTHMVWDREVEADLEIIKWEKKEWGLCTCVSAKGAP